MGRFAAGLAGRFVGALSIEFELCQRDPVCKPLASVWTTFAAALAILMHAAPPTRADVIASAGAVLGNSHLPGTSYALYGTSPVGTSANACSYSGATPSLENLPAGIGIQSAPSAYTCSGGYSTVTPPGGVAVESGLMGVHDSQVINGIGNVLTLNIGSGAPTNFTLGIVTNIDPQPFDYPDAFRLVSSSGGDSGVVATTKNPTGAVDTYLFTVTGATPGETITLSVYQSTQNVPYGGLGATIGGITFNVQPALRVTPATNIVASGPPGGPFSVSSFSYTLSATSGSVDYSISGVPDWLTPSSTAGTVSTTGTIVTFNLNASANSLGYNTYNAIITFTNTDTGLGTQTRAAALAVVPTISCVASSQVCPTLWWFNGAFPQPINYLTTLQATAGGVDYAWTITSGTQYARFINGLSSINTLNINSVVVFPNGDPGAGLPPPTVAVTAKVVSSNGTGTSTPFILTLNKPNSLLYSRSEDRCYKPNLKLQFLCPAKGYLSIIHYRIVDLKGMPLPFEVPASEKFGRTELDDLASKWPTPPEVGNPAADPTDFVDNISAYLPDGRPPSLEPQVPLGMHRIDHHSDSIGIGGVSPGAGANVETLTLQVFQDHGRHCNIQSPPDRPGNNQNPLGC